MTVGVLTAQFTIPDANSLKDKRQVVKSLAARLRADFNISVSEVGDHDIWRSAILGIAVVATDTSYANAVLDTVVDRMERDPRVDLGHCELEFR